ncbi:PD-(D/E)XK nuclease family protein [Methanocalculus sp.]|uniref:PD-(D/E)XK nuclease family protein n=1 Tax=Methanocalculus sp. TaxID=2004547 RepID=UPI0026395E42|nr:PD-(D/E)XK nuclease family protein [Methanocalculus sp.]MDG6250732.1 PD-(D/E)XK nuclease family protein [Methanocalculus sp.]
MTLAVKSKPYIIPEYSLTGDLLSYQTCGLQYRYQNRGALPPSIPVQLWFGEFIHGVMEEAYKTWRTDPASFRFPWSWEGEIRAIEMNVNRRLKAKGLRRPPRLFCPYDETMNTPGTCPDADHPHKLLASRRAEAAINTWGPHLFPLIDNAEVKLKGCREMISYQEGVHRSNYYGIKGIVDVISSVSIERVHAGNLIHHYINANPEIRAMIDELSSLDYEIIIDYKGMRRPPVYLSQSVRNLTWNAHEWQVLTYAWLRSRQVDAQRPIAGIIFYLNELVPSADDIANLKQELRDGLTDIQPTGRMDKQTLAKWKRGSKKSALSPELREQRCIRLIPITEERRQQSLRAFDEVVAEIENSIVQEMRRGSIQGCWRPNPVEKTCTACDFKHICPAVKGRYRMSVL